MIDDRFIVFMTSATEWEQVSKYIPGMHEMLQELGQLPGYPNFGLIVLVYQLENKHYLAAFSCQNRNVGCPHQAAGNFVAKAKEYLRDG